MIFIKGIKFRKIEGISLWPFILFRSKKPEIQLINHEKIHLRQQIEMLVIPFYIWYALEWLFKYYRFRDGYNAYLNISFEKEAYHNEKNADFLKTRKFWNFVNYI